MKIAFPLSYTNFVYRKGTRQTNTVIIGRRRTTDETLHGCGTEASATDSPRFPVVNFGTPPTMHLPHASARRLYLLVGFALLGFHQHYNDLRTVFALAGSLVTLIPFRYFPLVS